MKRWYCTFLDQNTRRIETAGPFDFKIEAENWPGRTAEEPWFEEMDENEIVHQGYWVEGGDDLPGYWEEPVTRGQLSCFQCAMHKTCEFAWDLYNTNGDCLAEK